MIHKICEFGTDFKSRAFYIFGRGRHAHDHKINTCEVISFSKILPNISFLNRHAGAITDEDIAKVAKQFECFANRYVPRTKSKPSPVFHSILSLDPCEALTKAQWAEVVSEYMAALGFGDAQYLAVQHSDLQHEHIHIIANRIIKTESGYRLVDSSQNRAKGMAVMRHVERRFGLSMVCDPQSTWQVSYTQQEVRRSLATGSSPWRGELLQLVAAAAENSREDSWSSFIQGCERLGVSISTRFDVQERPVGVSFGYRGRAISGRKLKSTRCSFQKLTSLGAISYEKSRDFQAAKAANVRHSIACTAGIAARSKGNSPEKPSSEFEGRVFMAKAILNSDQLRRLERSQLKIYQSRYFENRAVVLIGFKVPISLLEENERALKVIVLAIQLLLAVLFGIVGIPVRPFLTKNISMVNPLDLSSASDIQPDENSYRHCAKKLLGIHGWSVSAREVDDGIQQLLGGAKVEVDWVEPSIGGLRS